MLVGTHLRFVGILKEMQKEDKKFQATKLTGSWCSECKENTEVGHYPQWHIYYRELCSSCGAEYMRLLKTLGAYDDFYSVGGLR